MFRGHGLGILTCSGAAAAPRRRWLKLLPVFSPSLGVCLPADISMAPMKAMKAMKAGRQCVLEGFDPLILFFGKETARLQAMKAAMKSMKAMKAMKA